MISYAYKIKNFTFRPPLVFCVVNSFLEEVFGESSFILYSHYEQNTSIVVSSQQQLLQNIFFKDFVLEVCILLTEAAVYLLTE